jgi:hypothetical protein
MTTRNGNAPRGSAPSSPVAERLTHRGRSLNIAHLPNDIREQLNLRLLEGETAKELAAWLNALPAVRSVLGAQFNGSPISEVNLTNWRQGGYLQWLTERECFDAARALAEGDCDLATTGLSAERLLNVLTVRLGQLLIRWDFSPDESVSEETVFAAVAKKARILQGISRSLLAIHRIQSQSAAACGAATRDSSPAHRPLKTSPLPSDNPTAAASSAKTGARAASSHGRNGVRPEVLSGPITPSTLSAKLSHTPFNPDPDADLAEALGAV